MCPEGVTVHITRVPVPGRGEVTLETVQHVADQKEDFIRCGLR
jgi:hypothetical protein